MSNEEENGLSGRMIETPSELSEFEEKQPTLIFGDDFSLKNGVIVSRNSLRCEARRRQFAPEYWVNK
jgi:hypothetical protein